MKHNKLRTCNFRFQLVNEVSKGGGGGYRLHYETSLFGDTFYFNKPRSRNYKKEGAKSIHFLKALFKTNPEINASTLWLRGT